MFIHRILQAFSKKTNCLDTIPIFGHMKALIHYYLDEYELAAISFKEATHNTGVIFFGVLGGHFGDSAGFIVGGVIGGVLVDIPISTMSLTSTPYGYLKNLRTSKSRYMIAGEWFHLIKLIFKDFFTGLLALYAYNKYKIGMESCFNFCNFIKDIEFDIHLDMLDSIEKYITCLAGIPIGNEILLLKRHYEITGSNVQTFKWAIRKVYVAGFGIYGGYLAGSEWSVRTVAGSIAGGIIGGLLFDVLATALPSSRNDYTRYYIKMLRRNMKKLDWVEFLLWTVKDGISGVKPFIAYQILIQALKSYVGKSNEFATHRIGLKENIGRDISGNIYEVIVQRDMSAYINMSEPTTKTGYGVEIKCDLNTCEKYYITKEHGYSFVIKVLKCFYASLRESKNIPVVDISQLERGDHVVYERVFFGKYHIYDHHAIVEELCPEKLKYRVYEQTSSSIANDYRSTGKAWIKEIEKPFESISLFKKEHDDTDITKEIRRKTAHYICHHATTEEFEKTYNVLFNNCEHFVNVCSMGLHESQQVLELVADIIQVCTIVSIFLLGLQLNNMEHSIDTDFERVASATYQEYENMLSKLQQIQRELSAPISKVRQKVL